MLLLLPVAAWTLLFVLLRRRGMEWRLAALTATIGCAAYLAAGTEILSLPRMVTRAGAVILWVIACAAAGAWLWFNGRANERTTARESNVSAEQSTNTLDRATRALLFGAGVIVLLVGVTALVAAPDTWDAMEYHLPRVAMWMSNRNVGFFPTPDYCQLIYGPWAEYAMMHTQLLWGSDRFVNVVEFLSMVGSLLAASVIAKKLGAGARGQALAAVVCATIPEGILEASGPMNTYVVAFWMAASVAFFMEWNDDPNWLNFVCAALAAALAIFTKGTAYILLPFLLLACWGMAARRERVMFLRRVPLFVALVLALSAAQYVRCYQFTGSPLGVPLPVSYPRTEFVMGHMSVRATAANVIRNISLHLCTPSRAVNARIERVVRLAIRAVGVNPDDPSQIWIGLPFHMNHYTSNEIIAGNPLHLALLMISFVAVCCARRPGLRRRWAMWLTAGIVAAFVAFCALLRWEMWSSRYHLGLFVLGAALSGVVLEKYFSRRWAAALAAVALVLPGIFLACTNRSRSLIPWQRVDDVYQPRAALYFTNEHEAAAASYIAAASFVKRHNCHDVAIDSYVADPEVKNSPKSFFVYPLIALIKANGRNRRVWYVGVENLSSKYAEKQEHPAACAVVCLDCAGVPEKWHDYDGIGSPTVFGDIVVFAAGNEKRVGSR